MASDPWSILAQARSQSAQLPQIFMQAKRQRMEDLFRAKQVEQQDKQNEREDRKADREETAYTARLKAGQQAATGDITGARATAMEGGDFDFVETLGKMDEQQLKATGARADAVGQAAMYVMRAPKEQQPALWDNAIRNLSQQGYHDLDQYIGKYDPQALPSLIAASGAAKLHIEQMNKEADDARMAAAAAEAARHNRVTEGTAAGNLDLARKREGRVAKWGPQAIILGGGAPRTDTSDLDY